MANSKTTKRALLTSALAILACVAMLMGATFAWFTDAASTGVNRIQSGNLDVELWYKNAASKEDTTLEDGFALADKNTPIFYEQARWEPGHVEYAVLKVRNVGSLALKYQLGINIAAETGSKNMAGTDFKLSDYIRFAVLDGDQSELGRDALVEAATAADNRKLNEGYTVEERLLAGDTDSEKMVTLVLWMPTSVGNEANHKTGVAAPSIELGVNVYATQDTVEHDSFDDQYDARAEYATFVGTAAELQAAISAGENVVLESDLSLTNALAIPQGKALTIDLNGKTVTATGDFATVNAGSKLTVNGGTVISGHYAFNVSGGEVVVDDGSFTAQEPVFALFGGSKLTVNGGTFTANDNAVIATNGSSKEGCEITVNGGVFNGNITSDGYIACGIYVANKDTVNVNAGTFNVTDGVGILMRAGHTTIGKDVVVNLTNTGKVMAGKIGDASIDITTPSYLVMDVRSGYPGATAGFTITNNSAYELVEYK